MNYKNHIAAKPLPKIGIDIGGVIMDKNKGVKNEALEQYIKRPMIEGSLEGLHFLREYFKGRVVIVSKCKKESVPKHLAWLKEHNILEGLGITEDQVHWCWEKKDKAPICKELGVDIFIDDRAKVLNYMEGIIGQRIKFGADMDEEMSGEYVLVNSWQELLNHLQK